MDASRIRRNRENRSALDQVIIVMRHGERRDGAVGAAAEVDPPLTENAVDHIAAVAERLRSVMGSPKVKKLLLVVSPFQRTLETAQHLQKYDVGSTKPFIVDNTLCEVYGPSRIKSTIPPMLPAKVLKRGTGGLPEWGESMESAASRFVNAFYDNSRRYQDHNLLLVTHGDALSAILSSFYPMRTVYEADYLSFIVFKRSLQRSESVERISYELVTSDGVQWLLDGPEVCEERPRVQEAECSSGRSTSRGEDVAWKADCFPENPSLSIQAYAHKRSPLSVQPMLASDGNINGEHSIQISHSGVGNIALRIGAVLSQMLALLPRSSASGAAIYICVVAAVEALCIIADVPMCTSKCVNVCALIRRVEMLDFNSVIRDHVSISMAYNGGRTTLDMYLIIKQLAATGVKALSIFTLSCALAFLLSAAHHISFKMTSFYASFFTDFGNFCVFALFWLFNIMRGCYAEIERQ